LSKDELELWHRLTDRVERSKPKVDDKCDVCRLKQATRRIKTTDGLTLNLCEDCLKNNLSEKV